LLTLLLTATSSSEFFVFAAAHFFCSGQLRSSVLFYRSISPSRFGSSRRVAAQASVLPHALIFRADFPAHEQHVGQRLIFIHDFRPPGRARQSFFDPACPCRLNQFCLPPRVLISVIGFGRRIQIDISIGCSRPDSSSCRFWSRSQYLKFVRSKKFGGGRSYRFSENSKKFGEIH
jgi:hypothetical protein